LDVHSRYSNLVTNAFRADTGFVQAMDKALASFVNNNRITELAKTTSKSSELLARCCDMLLRKSSKNPEDRELETLLSQVVSFCYSFLLI
jgi:cullin 1